MIIIQPETLVISGGYSVSASYARINLQRTIRCRFTANGRFKGPGGSNTRKSLGDRDLNRIECCALGALGGVCPTIAKMASYFGTNPAAPMPEAGIYISLGLFALLGGIISAGFGAKTAQAALVAGITAPGIITNVVAGATEGRDQISDSSTQTVAEYMGVGAAFAESAVQDPTTEIWETPVNLKSTISGGLPSQQNLELFAIMKSDQEQVLVPIGTASQSVQTIYIPADATGIKVGDQAFEWELGSEPSEIHMSIETSPTLKGDLIWALGGTRTFDIRDVTVEYEFSESGDSETTEDWQLKN